MAPLSYKQRRELERDKGQSKLDSPTVRRISFPQQTRVTASLNVDILVMCPFCLYTAKLTAFVISTKKGFDHARGKCPECKNGMLLKSLTAVWTPEQYAEWVAEYSRFGFWQKIPYQTWRGRLEAIGWAMRFWVKYKEIKPMSSSDEYTEAMNKQAYEKYNPDEDLGE